jgi:hypothetical protein
MLNWVGMTPYFVIYLTSYFVTYLNHMVQEGTFMREILALLAETVCSENRIKVWHTPIVDLCLHVVISVPYT